MFKRVVNAVEVVALLAAAAFVIMLFANEPGGGSSTAIDHPGAAVYAANCAGCHGSDGGGGRGPRLAGGQVVEQFPDSAAEIAVVANGRGSMPAFGGRLSPAEIADVVDYTRRL